MLVLPTNLFCPILGSFYVFIMKFALFLKHFIFKGILRINLPIIFNLYVLFNIIKQMITWMKLFCSLFPICFEFSSLVHSFCKVAVMVFYIAFDIHCIHHSFLYLYIRKMCFHIFFTLYRREKSICKTFCYACVFFDDIHWLCVCAL